MVGLQEVVRVGLCVVEGRRQQLIEHPGVDPVPVGGDLHRRDPGPPDRSLEEPAGCLGVRRGERCTSMTWPNWSMARNR